MVYVEGKKQQNIQKSRKKHNKHLGRHQHLNKTVVEQKQDVQRLPSLNNTFKKKPKRSSIEHLTNI